MMARFLLAALALVTTAMLPAPQAQAWNEIGHMTVAKLAWDRMKLEQREAAFKTLSGLPQLDRFLAENPRPANIKADELLFVISATWPDWIKEYRYAGENQKGAPPGTPENLALKAEHHEGFHFIDTPFFFPSKDKFKGKMPKALPLTILVALETEIPKMLKDSADDRRAVGLCWLLHCTGDIHQPLHCASLFSSEYPRGDVGANQCLVKFEGHPINLHAFWDDRVGSIQKGKSAQQNSEKAYKRTLANSEILTRPDFDKEKFADQLTKTKFSDWADECHALAVKYAYRENKLPRRAFFTQFPSAEDKQMAPALEDTQGYVDDSLRVANLQVALAGYRLTTLLDSYFPKKK